MPDQIETPEPSMSEAVIAAMFSDDKSTPSDPPKDAGEKKVPDAKPVEDPEIAKAEADAEKLTAKVAPVKKEPVATPDAITDETPSGLSKKAGEHFEALKKKSNAAVAAERARVSALEKELAEVKTKSGNIEELKAVQAERDQLSELLKAASLERHPQFRKEYDVKQQKIIAEAKEVSSEHASAIEKLMQNLERREDWDALLSEMTPTQQTDLGALRKEMRRLSQERAEKLANSGESLKQLEESEKGRREQMTKQSQAVFSEVIKEAVDAGYSLLAPIEGNAEHNAAVNSRIESAKKLLFENNDARSFAAAALRASMCDEYAQAFHAAHKLNALYKQKLAKMQAAQPGVRGAGGSDNGSSAVTTPEMSMQEAVLAQARSMGILREQ